MGFNKANVAFNRLIYLISGLMFLVALPTVLIADKLPEIELPKSLKQDQVILMVEGKIQYKSPVLLDLATLKKFPSVSFSTYDPWDKRQRRYTGIKLMDLLRILKIEKFATRVVVVAKNDYKAIISLKDVQKYSHILSYKMDDTLYSNLPDKDNKGPLAVAIDFTGQDVNVDVYKQQLVWWISHIVVK